MLAVDAANKIIFIHLSLDRVDRIVIVTLINRDVSGIRYDFLSLGTQTEFD